MKIPKQSKGAQPVAFMMIQVGTQGMTPSGPFDWLCKKFNLPWCDTQEETCFYDRTDTSCWGVVLMCKERGWTASGRSCSGGWYACGICLGLPF